MKYERLFWLLSVLTLSCAQQPFPPPPSVSTQTIAVLPPNNCTGDSLIVASDSFWNPYGSQAQKVTVADVLAAEARLQLEQHGFTVIPDRAVEAAIGSRRPSSREEAVDLAARGKLEGNVLYIEIKRWEPDVPIHPERVFVALEACLIDTVTGDEVWAVHLPLRPVPTPGAISRWVAYTIAAHDVAEELLSSWGTKRPTS